MLQISFCQPSFYYQAKSLATLPCKTPLTPHSFLLYVYLWKSLISELCSMFLEIYLYEILISNEDWMAASCKLSKYITLKLLHSWRAVAVVAWLLAVLLHIVIVFGSMAVALSGPLLTLIILVLAVRWPLRFLCSCSPCCCCCCGSSCRCCCCGSSCWWSEATATDSTRLQKNDGESKIWVVMNYSTFLQ